MMLRVRMLVMSLLVALPAALLVTYLIDRGRTADEQVALDRVVRSQINAQVRERCESDPTWFLTGPLEGRPAGGVFIETSPDQLPPRPRVTTQPFELFAYDEAFVGSSSGSARFPQDFKRLLRTDSVPVFASYATASGTGVQMAIPTGWRGGPCMYFLGRMEAPANQMRQRLVTFAGLYVLFALVAALTMTPTVFRIRRQAAEAREAVASGYKAMAPDQKKDELSSMTFVYNDISNELQIRKARIDDQDAALRRLAQSTDDEIAKPLAELEAGLAALAANSANRTEIVAQLRRAHDLSAIVENLAAATKLRLAGASLASAPVDLNALVTRVVDRHRSIAQAAGVTIQALLPLPAVVVDTDETLLTRAVANIVDNASRYNRSGGEVTVRLERAASEPRFRLFVTDNGPGVTEEEFRGLTAVRRFRGDESRNRRPGAPGLGLAIAREVTDRLGFTLDLKRPAAGGFEVEFAGPTSSRGVQ
ncbi:MAG: HAMP domain-containing sensor histidine kinase [Acidobacteriota bacterium]